MAWTGGTSERGLRLYSGGNYDYLIDYLDRREIRAVDWANGLSFTGLSGAQATLIDAGAGLSATTIAADVTASGFVANGEIVAAQDTFTAGTAAASTNTDTDDDGVVVNLVEIRDSATNNEVVYDDSGTDRRVYGLVQAASGITDNATAVNTTASSENLQISFVYFDSADTITLVPGGITGDIEVSHRIVRSLRNNPATQVVPAPADLEAIDSANVTTERRLLEVTAATTANEQIGVGGDSTNADLTARRTSANYPNEADLSTWDSDFVANGQYRILLNGVEVAVADQATDFTGIDWAAARVDVDTSVPIVAFQRVLDIGEVIEIVVPTA